MVARRNLSGVDTEILHVLDTVSVDGVKRLAALIRCHNVAHMRQRLLLLNRRGLVIMEYPTITGRGHKVVIRRGYITEASES